MGIFAVRDFCLRMAGGEDVVGALRRFPCLCEKWGTLILSSL